MHSHYPYELPTIDFVGGETQNFAFRMFSVDKKPYELYGCEASFAILNFLNKTGQPIITKDIPIDNNTGSVLYITLLPEDTVDLSGKYIYQISLRNEDTEVEIPKQGIIYITNNINKNFIKQ